MNKSIRMGLIGVLLVSPVYLVSIARTAAPPTPPPPLPPADDSIHLYQLDDSDFVDLTETREIGFQQADTNAIANGASPYSIAFWQRGATENPFRFNYADKTSAYDAWKKLVAHLHGSLHEDQWKIPATLPDGVQTNARQ
jgi:hypothetical protein